MYYNVILNLRTNVTSELLMESFPFHSLKRKFNRHLCDYPMSHNDLHRHVQNNIEDNIQEDTFICSPPAVEPNKL